MRTLTSIFCALSLGACGTLGAPEQALDDGASGDGPPRVGTSVKPTSTDTSSTVPVGTQATSGAPAMNGSSTTPPSSASPNPTSGSVPTPGELAQPLRRLSHREYANTVKSLLPAAQVTLPALATDETIDGFTNNWDAQKPSDLLVEQYFNIAVDVAEGLDDAAISALTGCAAGIECAKSFIAQFGKQALRRPLTPEEASQYLTIFETGPGNGDFPLGVRLTVAAMLQSPHFLYRVEFGVGESEPIVGKRLLPYETATRLSYLLWANTPDAALFDAAESGRLDDAAGIETEAQRMLADPKAKEGVTNFFREWLKLSKLSKTLKLAEENWDEAFRADLTESVIRFTYDQVFDQGGSARDLLLATRFPMTPGIADLFGLQASGDTWQDLDASPSERSGLLTHPGILGAYGYGEYPSPVLRGVFVLDRFMCMPPTAPPDPAAVQPPEPGTAENPRTNREAYVQATSGAGCAACHTAINGIGFAFENYDTVGRYRTKDSTFDVDASGNVGSFTFDNAVDFSKQLADSQEYQNCVVSKWATYALGGSPLARDAQFLSDLGSKFQEESLSLKGLLLAIATHERFSGRLSTGTSGL